MRREVTGNGAEDADGRDERRRKSASLAADEFRNKRDASAEFARESETGDETQHAVLVDRAPQTERMQETKWPFRIDVGHRRVQEIRKRVAENRAEQDAQSSAAIGDHAPHEAADQEARRLQDVVEPDTVLGQDARDLGFGFAREFRGHDLRQRRLSHEGEE